ncbi:MAG: hypothetical protein AABZ67_02395, partial [Pseudomonadota bacterium]
CHAGTCAKRHTRTRRRAARGIEDIELCRQDAKNAKEYDSITAIMDLSPSDQGRIIQARHEHHLLDCCR